MYLLVYVENMSGSWHQSLHACEERKIMTKTKEEANKLLESMCLCVCTHSHI